MLDASSGDGMLQCSGVLITRVRDSLVRFSFLSSVSICLGENMFMCSAFCGEIVGKKGFVELCEWLDCSSC